MDTFFTVVLLLSLTLLVLPIVSIALAVGARRRERDLRDEVARLAQRVFDLELRASARPPARQEQAPAPRQEQAPAPRPEPAPAPRAPPAEAPLETVAVAPPPVPPAPPAVALPIPVAPPVPPAPPIPLAQPAPIAPAAAPPIPQPPTYALPPPVPVEAGARTTAARPPPPPPPGLLAALKAYDWERLIGVRLFSILAGVVLAFAGIFLIQLSIEKGLVTPKVRFTILTAVGVALVLGSELRVARRYAVTTQPLAAGGLVTLFATFFAGHSLWHFYGGLPAFGLLALVTVVAMLLAIRRSSLVVAVLGLLGGFSTPILVSTGEDRPIPLFGYLLLLNVALAWVSYKRRWAVLTWLSLAFTALYQAGWVGRFLDESGIPLALAIFLVFTVVGFLAIRLGSRSAKVPAAASRWAAAAVAPPALFALYLAATPSLAAPWPLLLGFVALLAAGLAAVAAWPGPEWLHVGGAGMALVVSAAAATRAPGAGPLLLAFAVLVAVYVGPAFLLPRLGRAFRAEGRMAALAIPLLALYVAGNGALVHWQLMFGFLALAAAGLAAVAAWQGPEWLHPAGAGLILAAVAIYLGGSFTPGDWPILVLFVALLAAVYLGAPLLLARLGRDFRAEGRRAVLAAPLLLVAFVPAASADTAAAPLHFLAPLLALAALLSGWAVLRSDARVHVLSSALALLAAATWSGFHLDAARLYPALLSYGLLGALLLAAPLLAERRGRPLTGAMTAPLLLGAMLLLTFLAKPLAGAVIGGLVGLTALAALLQAALFLMAARGRNPMFAVAGVVIGFVELALWAVAGLAAALLPGLIAVAVLSFVAVAGALLVAPQGRAEATPSSFPAAPFLGLTGHLFLAAVAFQRELALPPAPWLAVLGVLDLGFVVAALLRRRSELMVGAAVATVVVLFAHMCGLEGLPPAAIVGTGAALGAGALFFAGHLAERWRRAEPRAGLGPSGVAAVIALHFAQLLLLQFGGDLPIALLVASHLGLLVGLLALAWISGAEWLALSTALISGASGLVLCTFLSDDPGLAVPPAHGLLVATVVWLVALAYPLLRGARGRKEWFPFVAAALASGIYLLAARKALVRLGAGPYIGALPVIQAALLMPHLRLLLRMERPAERDLRRLALMAASILGLVTVAIPLQLEKQWWTIGWATLAAALAWLWGRVPHRGLLVWAAALFAASFVRLVPFFNLSVFAYHPRSGTPIWNWYLYTYLAVAAAHFAGAFHLSRGDDRPWARAPRLSHLAATAGALLLFFLLNIEIADYWSSGTEIVFRFSAGVAPDLTYTIGWAVFAIGLLAAGVALRSRAPRIASIALLAVTVLKGFLHDLGSLTGMYRVASLAGLAVSLALVAVVLQRFVLRRGDAPPPQAPTSPEANP